MRMIRIKQKYLDFMRDGLKTAEVRVAYDHIKNIKPGELISFLSRSDRLVRKVRDVRRYRDFDEMLQNEDYQTIIPDLDKSSVIDQLREIYPPHKEELGVIVLDISDN